MTRAEYNKSVDELSDNLFRFAIKLSGNEFAANDLVQDAFTKLWTKHEQVEAAKCKSYLFTTLYNRFIDSTRRGKFQSDQDVTVEISPSTSEQYSDLKEILNEAMEQLPEIQKTVIMLRDYEGYSYDEIAEITNLSESQVKVYIFRGRKTLRKYLVSLDVVI